MWSLKVVKGAELAEKLAIEMRLPQPLQRFTIGRDPANHWPIADRTLAISARHCEIVDTPDGPALRDLSTNGTFVNGGAARLSGQHLLRDGDRIELGPYDILVSGPPMPARPAAVAAAAAPAPAPRSPGVLDTSPQRGGDPAAMLALGGGHERVGLTEILRAAPPSDDAGLDLTRIRVAPPPAKPAAAPAAVPAPVSVPVPVSAPAPAQAPAPALMRTVQPLPPERASAQPGTAGASADALAHALARGLGVPPQALEGHDLLLLVERLAAAARSTQDALRPLADVGGAPPPSR